MERARSLSEVFNSDNSIDSGAKALINCGAVLADTAVAWNVIETPIWWLKLIGILTINAPLGLMASYQFARTIRQGETEAQSEARLERLNQAREKLTREQRSY